MKQPTEEWRYTHVSDEYMVSNLGNVKTLKQGRNRLMKLSYNNLGYACVSMRIDKRTKMGFVHRLVAFAFLGTPAKGMQVNHKNKNQTDNRLENLEWCTCLENVRHSRGISFPQTPQKYIDSKNRWVKNNPERMRELRRRGLRRRRIKVRGMLPKLLKESALTNKK